MEKFMAIIHIAFDTSEYLEQSLIDSNREWQPTYDYACIMIYSMHMKSLFVLWHAMYSSCIIFDSYEY